VHVAFDGDKDASNWVVTEKTQGGKPSQIQAFCTHSGFECNGDAGWCAVQRAKLACPEQSKPAAVTQSDATQQTGQESADSSSDDAGADADGDHAEEPVQKEAPQDAVDALAADTWGDDK